MYQGNLTGVIPQHGLTASDGQASQVCPACQHSIILILIASEMLSYCRLLFPITDLGDLGMGVFSLQM